MSNFLPLVRCKYSFIFIAPCGSQNRITESPQTLQVLTNSLSEVQIANGLFNNNWLLQNVCVKELTDSHNTSRT